MTRSMVRAAIEFVTTEIQVRALLCSATVIYCDHGTASAPSLDWKLARTVSPRLSIAWTTTRAMQASVLCSVSVQTLVLTPYTQYVDYDRAYQGD
jgi:hypothetical protein